MNETNCAEASSCHDVTYLGLSATDIVQWQSCTNPRSDERTAALSIHISSKSSTKPNASCPDCRSSW